MPSRSLRIHSNYVAAVRAAHRQAYDSSRCSNQREFASLIKVDETKTGMGIDTLNNFLDGKAVDRSYFFALCDRLGLKASEICIESNIDPALKVKEQDRLFELTVAPLPEEHEMTSIQADFDEVDAAPGAENPFEETPEHSAEASEPEKVQESPSKPRTVTVTQTATHVQGLMIGYVEGDINTKPQG